MANALGDLLKLAGPVGGPPITRTQTSYAATLLANVGSKFFAVGGVTDFQERQGQQVDEEFTLRRGTNGRPDALTVQTLNQRTINIKRYELYGLTMAQVFALNEMATIADQGFAWALRVVWTAPTGITGIQSPLISTTNPATPNVVESALAALAEKRIYQYVDCVFTNMGTAISTGNPIVIADASLIWRDKQILQ